MELMFEVMEMFFFFFFFFGKGESSLVHVLQSLFLAYDVFFFLCKIKPSFTFSFK